MKKRRWDIIIPIILLILIIIIFLGWLFFTDRKEDDSREKVSQERIVEQTLKNYHVEYRLSTIQLEESIYGYYEDDHHTFRIYGITSDQDVVLTDQKNLYLDFVKMLEDTTVYSKYVTTKNCSSLENELLNEFIKKSFQVELSGNYTCRFELKDARLVTVQCQDAENQISFYTTYTKN